MRKLTEDRESSVGLGESNQVASRRLSWRLFALSSLMGACPYASEKTKIHATFLAVRCFAVFTERIFVESRRTPQRIRGYSQGVQRRIGGNPPVKTGLRSTLPTLRIRPRSSAAPAPLLIHNLKRRIYNEKNHCYDRTFA